MNLIKIFTLFALFFSTAAHAQKVKNLEFQSNTRGFQEKIVINKNKVHLVRISPQGKVDTTFSLSQKDWAQLNKIVKGINLKHISVIKSPTEYSQTDGAKASTITVNTEKESFTSSTFDNYNAPKELIPLMEKISAYANKIK
jgi:hypothetical protein